MALVGSRKDAAFISEWFEQAQSWSNTPVGWTLLGSGSFRAVFLHIESDVAYKLDCAGYEDPGYDSRQEVSVARRLRKRTFSKVRIPATSGYNIGGKFVVAMERVDGTMGGSSNPATFREGLLELFRIGFMDMHEWNYMIDSDGFVVPVDMASPISKRQSDIRVLLGLPEYQEIRDERGWN